METPLSPFWGFNVLYRAFHPIKRTPEFNHPIDYLFRFVSSRSTSQHIASQRHLHCACAFAGACERKGCGEAKQIPTRASSRSPANRQHLNNWIFRRLGWGVQASLSDKQKYLPRNPTYLRMVCNVGFRLDDFREKPIRESLNPTYTYADISSLSPRLRYN